MTIDANGRPAIAELGNVERAVGDVDDEVTDLGSASKWDGMKSSLSDVTDQLGPLKGAAGFAGVGAAVLGVATQAAELATEVETVATALDLDVDAASRLRAAFADVGLDAAGVVGFTLSISDQLQNNVDLADKLGVNIQTVADNPIEAVRAGIDNWDLLTPTERAQLFGEEGVLAISKMIDEGSTLTDILEGVDDTRVFTQEQLDRAKEFNEATADLKGAWEGIVISLSDSFIPLLAESGGLVADLVNQLNGFEVGGKNKLSIFSSWPDVFRAADEQFAKVYNGVGDLVTGADDAGEALFDAGNIAEGEWSKAADAVNDTRAALDAIPTNKTIRVTVEESLRRIGTGFSTTNNNVTVNVPRSLDGREVDAVVRRWALNNG
jgi:hypothetical protein